MILSHIVATSQNGVIGNQGKLPWHIPEDLKFFKGKTINHSMIMGRKTFESLPSALPKRLNVVVTRNKDYQAKGAHVFETVLQAIHFCRQKQGEYGEEVFIVGGGEIFHQTLEIVDRIYLTLIHQDYIGDAFYPVREVTESSQFKEVERIDRTEPIPFSFLTFERRK